MAVVVERLKALIQRFRGWNWQRFPWGTLGELALIVAWAMWVTRPYLNMNPQVWVAPNDLALSLPSHFVWPTLTQCGVCVLWNGGLHGGAPTFVETFGASLHPLVVIATLLWGVMNGVKILLVASFAIAGIAQWWLAKVLRLGLWARLWSAAMAIVAGHLAARMQLGFFALVFSTAFASLVIPAGLELGLSGRRRSAVMLGAIVALTLLSGQGYMQIGLLFSILPAFLVFLFDESLRLRPVWKEHALAGVLTILLTGVFLIPLLHFLPYFEKEGFDLTFKWDQPAEYAPLNLVIRDRGYWTSPALQKTPGGEWHYATYIGWGPVLLALAALRVIPRSANRVLSFMLLGIGLAFLASGAFFSKLLVAVSPAFATGIRNTSVMAGLAVPLILALAAWGLNELPKLSWPELVVLTKPGVQQRGAITLRFSWLLFIPLLLGSLYSALLFGQSFIKTMPAPVAVRDLLQTVKLDRAEWITPPYPEHIWQLYGLEGGYKLTGVAWPWRWKNRPFPAPYIEITRNAPQPGTPNVRAVQGAYLITRPENEYAIVASGTITIPCRAQAIGGNIDVDCDAEVAGTLIVRENSWSGWTVRRDGQPVELGPGPWLNVYAPEGKHRYEFRYRPWDVPAGLTVTCIGIGLAIWLWIKYPDRKTRETEEPTEPKSDLGMGT